MIRTDPGLPIPGSTTSGKAGPESMKIIDRSWPVSYAKKEPLLWREALVQIM